MTSLARDLTAIIPTWNGSHLLSMCLRSLTNQTVPCAVLVVDNGSTDATSQVIDRARQDFSANLDWLRLERNFGFARAVNEGLRRARSPYIALLNNDTEADRRWVEAGLEGLRGLTHYSLFASRVINFHHRDILDTAGDCYDCFGVPHKRGWGRSVEEFSRAEPVLGASGAAAFYRRELFDEIGLFDEDYFMYLEDIEISLRAQLKGHSCLYLPDAIVYHMEAASDVERGKTLYSSRRVYWITRNQWQLMLTYQPARNLPWLLVGWVHTAGVHFLKRRQSRAFLRGLAAGVRESPKALQKRRTLRRTQTISPHEFHRLLNTC